MGAVVGLPIDPNRWERSAGYFAATTEAPPAMSPVTAPRFDRWALPRSLPIRLYLVGAMGLAASAIYGGGRLIADPSGASIGLSVDWLRGSPFGDYFVPGLVLFAVFGLGSLAVCVGLVGGHRWTTFGAPGLGLALVGWIVVQIGVLGTVSALHLVYGGLGIVLVALSTRRPDRTGAEG